MAAALRSSSWTARPRPGRTRPATTPARLAAQRAHPNAPRPRLVIAALASRAAREAARASPQGTGSETVTPQPERTFRTSPAILWTRTLRMRRRWRRGEERVERWAAVDKGAGTRSGAADILAWRHSVETCWSVLPGPCERLRDTAAQSHVRQTTHNPQRAQSTSEENPPQTSTRVEILSAARSHAVHRAPHANIFPTCRRALICVHGSGLESLTSDLPTVHTDTHRSDVAA